MFSLTAAGLFRSTRTGSLVMASATFPAVSRADTFRYTLWVGKLAGSFHGYDPAFGSRLATPELVPRLSAAATGVHGPFGPSAHSIVIGSVAKFRSVASQRRTIVSFWVASGIGMKIWTMGGVMSTSTRRSGASPGF